MAGLKPVWNVVVVGPNYSGKDTVLQHLLGVVENSRHISTGNLLRANKKEGTLLGKIAGHFDEQRRLTPDTYMDALVANSYLSMKPGTVAFWVGYPRTRKQYNYLRSFFSQANEDVGWQLGFDAIIYLDVSDNNILRSRAAGRLNCKPCGLVYHEEFVPPKIEYRCDKCNGGLYVRPEDRDEKLIANGQQEYAEKTQPMIYYMRVTHPKEFAIVDASQPAVDVKADAEQIVRELLKQ